MKIIAAIVVALILCFLKHFEYKPLKKPIEGSKQPLKKPIQSPEPKQIDFDKFNHVLENTSAPCKYFHDRPDLLFTLPANQIILAFEKLDDLRCFSNQDFLLKIVDLTFKHERKDLIPYFLLSRAEKESLGAIFYKCAEKKYYQCVEKMMKDDPMITYNGKNILHLASIFSDDHLLEHVAPRNVPYLHLREKKSGNVPTKFVNLRSYKMIGLFESRAELEYWRTPYPKELQAHIEYMSKSYVWRIETQEKRINLLFTDYSMFQMKAELTLNVPRNDILEYSFRELNSKGFKWYTPSYYSQFSIKFVDESGVSELVSANDWIRSLINCFFASDQSKRPLFKQFSYDSHYYIPTESYSESYYKFAGSIIAMALKYGITTRVEFIPTIYRLILDIEPVRTEDLELVQPDLYKNLMSLRESFKKGEAFLDGSFSNVGEIDTYINNYASSLLYDRNKKYLKAFAEGFKSRIPSKISEYLDVTDLRDFLKGHVSISFDDLKRNISCSPLSETISDNEIKFFEVLRDFTDEQRFKFFQFVTGKSGLPYGGILELERRITVNFNARPKGYLPTAVNCFSSISLPHFDSTAELKKSLLFAIYNCETIERE